MRGHEPLLKLRRHGYKPRHVRLVDGDGKPFAWWRAEPLCGPRAVSELLPYPEVAIGVEDSPERLDLRFVVGCDVFVQSASRERLLRLVLACEAVGARQVFGVGAGAPLCTMGGDQSWRT